MGEYQVVSTVVQTLNAESREEAVRLAEEAIVNAGRFGTLRWPAVVDVSKAIRKE